jgi:hypothetical protein
VIKRLAMVSGIYWFAALAATGLAVRIAGNCTSYATYELCMQCLSEQSSIRRIGLISACIGFPIALVLSELWRRYRR